MANWPELESPDQAEDYVINMKSKGAEYDIHPMLIVSVLTYINRYNLVISNSCKKAEGGF